MTAEAGAVEAALIFPTVVLNHRSSGRDLGPASYSPDAVLRFGVQFADSRGALNLDRHPFTLTTRSQTSRR